MSRIRPVPVDDNENLYAEVLSAERALISACLIRPDKLPEIVARVKPADIVNDLHRELIGTLSLIAEEGRTPALEALSLPYGDHELSPGITVRHYLASLVNERLREGVALPWADAVEVVIDRARRRRLAAVGSKLLRVSDVAVRASDLAIEAIGELDELLADIRHGQRSTYSAEGAADAAIARLDSAERDGPATGLEDLDELIGGWPLGEVSVVAGRPGAGKSCVGTSLLLRMAKAGVCSVLFSLEMTREQLGARILSDLVYQQENPITYDRIMRRQLDERERQAILRGREMLKELPIHIEQQQGLTVSEIAARTRKAAHDLERRGKRLRCVCVDHMMLIRASDRYSGNRVREVGEISEGLMMLAKELDIAVLALCQLNRAVESRENKRPSLSDLRDSGEVEQNASLVTFLFRPAYYLMQPEDDPEAEQLRCQLLEKRRHDLEFGVAKNRNGRVGTVLAFVDIGANAVRSRSTYMQAKPRAARR